MADWFLPALYQPPSGWFPGGAFAYLPALMDSINQWMPGGPVEDRFTPALMNDAGGAAGLVPGTGKLAEPLRAASGEMDCPNWQDSRHKGTPAYYPHSLVAYPHWSGITHRPFPDDGFLFGDSGGFTVMTMGESIDPVDVIRWQIRTGCNVGALLDVPPVDQHGVRHFKQNMAKTVRNLGRALPVYQEHLEDGGPFRLWGVVHGWTIDDLQEWWEAISRVYPFTDDGEGWAFKPRPNITPKTVARVLDFIRRHPEIKRAHCLMTTGLESVAVLMALGPQAGLEFVSYDSTSFTLMATNRTLQLVRGDGLDWEKVHERGEERSARDYLVKECQCASCHLLRQDIQRYPKLLQRHAKWGGYWVYRFAYHNLLATVQVYNNLREAITQDTDRTLRSLLGKGYGPVMRAFEGREAFSEETGTGGGLLRHI